MSNSEREEQNMKIALVTGTSSFVPVISQAVCNASKAYVRFLGQALHAEMKKKRHSCSDPVSGQYEHENECQGHSG